MGFIEGRDIHDIDEELKEVLNSEPVTFYYSVDDPYTPEHIINLVSDHIKNGIVNPLYSLV